MQNLTPKQRSLISRIFLSPDEPRLRAGWRLAVQVLVFIFALFVFAIPFSVLYLFPQEWLRYLVGDMAGNLELLAGAPPQLLATIVSVLVARRFIDRRSITSLGLRWDRQAWRDLLAGILITAPMMGAIFSLEWALGWLRFDSFAWHAQDLPAIFLQTLFLFAIFVIVGYTEELQFRGYWQVNLTEGLNLAWATLLSSLAFSLAHLFNPGISPAAVIGLLLAGLFFVYAVQRTGRLWLAIGLHIGWNFFEGPVFGFQVSGLDAFRLIEQEVQGPEIWTGGAFGPEAGLVLLVALALGMVMVTLYTRKQGSKSVT